MEDPPASCPRCLLTEQAIDQAQDKYVRQVYGPITRHVGQLLNEKLKVKK